jgi:hypothetical protein
MDIDKLVEKFTSHYSYLGMGSGKIAKQFKVSREDVKTAKRKAREILDRKLWETMVNDNHLAFSSNRNILVIGDLHAPFTRVDYLKFCKEVYLKHNCNQVIFIGDIIDNHYSSFHDTDPDGHSGAEELAMAKASIKEWHKEFPNAKVCIGNHDLIPVRKAFNAGLSKTWIRPLEEVLGTPTWEFGEEFVIDNILYTHGTGRKAAPRMKYDMISIVQGHYHSESYISYAVGKNSKMFAMQVGCGVDDKSYAMAYGKHFNKMHINCGVILNNGQLPILEYMNL